MVSLEPIHTSPNSMIIEPTPTSSPRISFSADLLDESDFISISPRSHKIKIEPRSPQHQQRSAAAARNQDFEFLSNVQTSSNATTILTADELFSEGKLLPFWQIHNAEKLKNISIKPSVIHQETEAMKETDNNNRGNWFVDDDPSPRPPNCTVLWKELLRLRKQRPPSTLSPSSSTSSSSSSSSSNSGGGSKRAKSNGLERTRSGGSSVRIRPMINVPICTQGGGRTSALPPLFPLNLKKGRLDR